VAHATPESDEPVAPIGTAVALTNHAVPFHDSEKENDWKALF